jgi:signal transduction histidine kinase
MRPAADALKRAWSVPAGAAARYALEAALFVACYLALDWLSYIEPLGSFNITPWNPGPALAIVWMMRAGLGRAPVVLAATFLADDVLRNVPAHYAVTLLSAAALTLGYATIAVALRVHHAAGRTLWSVGGLTVLVGAVVIGAAINATTFLGILTGAGQLSGELFLEGWLRFWLGDVVGILVTAPLLLVALDAGKRRALAALARRGETYLQAGIIVVMLWAVVAGALPDPSHGLFLLFPPLIWIALRSGLVGALVAVTIVQLGVVAAFHYQLDPALPIVELQVLVATLTLTGLYLGATVDERERTMARLAESQHLAAAGEMAGAITHEVSQALTALASYSRSAGLRSQAIHGDAELATLIEKIHAESMRASRVVRRLRDFFRAGTMRLQPLGAPELVDMIGRLGKEATADSAISFAHSAEGDLPAVLVDALQIELVLRNLVANAVDSLQEYAAGRGEIAVRVTRERARLRIAVIDSGPGIPAGAEVFRPFASGKPSGMGLGLAVSRAIAEAHGGALEVASARHGEFHLVLPLESAHA